MAPGASIDSQTLQALVSRAVLDTLTEDDKRRLLEEGVRNAVTSSGYSRSAVQVVFETAVREAVSQIAHERLAQSEQLRARVGRLVDDALAAAVSDDARLRTLVSEHVGRALLDWKYEGRD